MKIVTIVGARPQFVKAAAVSRAIAEYNDRTGDENLQIRELIVHTGQHYDSNMSDVFFTEMHIPRPDYHLNINSLSHGAMTGRMMEKIEHLLLEESPDLLMVYGDTNSTVAGSMAASKLHIPIAHVEAGLRSFNRKMPEEINRVVTDHLSTILFCPTVAAVKNLEAEGIKDGDVTNVRLSGDVMLDAALFYKTFARQPDFKVPANFILSTIHRAENTDDPEKLSSILSALERISEETPVILPVHPRTRKIIRYNRFNVEKSKIIMTAPVSYLEMVYMLTNCRMVITDSGGLQKEAFFFGKPCVTLRDETEWVELVENGVNRLSGTDAETICNTVEDMIDFSVREDLKLYGEGRAAGLIVDELIKQGIFS